METCKQALDRAATLLKEFSIPNGVLRVLDANERPMRHNGQHEYSDGRYYGNNNPYYRVTYCVHTSGGHKRVILSVEVRQNFNADAFQATLAQVTDLIKCLAQLSVEQITGPHGVAKLVRTRKSHSCFFEGCSNTEIPSGIEVVLYRSGHPEYPTRHDGRWYYHRECYKRVRLVKKHRPAISKCK